MDNSTQVVNVTADFFKPTPLTKGKVLSVKDKAIELAWSFKRKPAKISLAKGSEVVFEKEFGIAPPMGHAIVQQNNVSNSELKHLRKMFKNQTFTVIVKR
jgi:hypothetical protein